MISNEGKFANPNDVDIIIATLCIQAGQSIKETLHYSKYFTLYFLINECEI